jgi:hypothetical protein
MVDALCEGMDDKIQKYTGKPPTCSMDEFHLLVYYDQALFYNSPVGGPSQGFGDAADAARRRGRAGGVESFLNPARHLVSRIQRCGLANQFKAFEILLRPAGFLFNHALQGFAPEGATPAVKDDGDPSTIGMVIDLVRPVAAVIAKPVTDEGRNNFAGVETPKLCVVDTHGSDGHGYTRFDGDLYLIGRFFRNGFAVLKHALHNHVDDTVDVLESFSLRSAPG